MVGRNLSLSCLPRPKLAKAGAKSKEARRAFTRSDGLGSRRIKHDGWEAVTPWWLLIPRISNAGAASSAYFSGIAWQALECLVSWIDDNADGCQSRHTQEWLCSRGSKDHAPRSRFSHEFDPDQAKRILPDGAVGQLVRHFPFLFNPKLFEFIRGCHRVRRSGIDQEK